jgi:hypothetical protein
MDLWELKQAIYRSSNFASVTCRTCLLRHLQRVLSSSVTLVEGEVTSCVDADGKLRMWGINGFQMHRDVTLAVCSPQNQIADGIP